MRQPVPFGKYLLLDRISVGGMAEVFKAKSYGVEGFEKIIAIKRILPTMGEDRDFIKMFIDEAKIAGQLAHANICQIFELGRIDGSHFIAMEYIWGKDLLQIQNRLRKIKQPMPVAMACFCIAKVLEGLDYAHRKRDPLGRPLEIVHRDCSPQNVLVSYEGEVKVIDFGIAKATSRNSRTMAGVLKGKFGYMSPEQVRGLPLDRRSDIFAIGTMLYECLTSDRLFQGETDFSTLEKVRNVDIRPPRELNPNIPEAVERVILKALAKDVDDRYQWCSEMLADLQQYLMGQDVVFTAKSLSSWLKEVFTAEIDKERQLLEQYKRVGRDGLIAGMPSADAKLDVVEHLGEAPEAEGDATTLGGPNLVDLDVAVGARAAVVVGPAPGSPAALGGSPSERAASREQGEDDGDFGEEAPTEIFGEIDDGPKPATPAPMAQPQRSPRPSVPPMRPGSSLPVPMGNGALPMAAAPSDKTINITDGDAAQGSADARDAYAKNFPGLAQSPAQPGYAAQGYAQNGQGGYGMQMPNGTPSSMSIPPPQALNALAPAGGSQGKTLMGAAAPPVPGYGTYPPYPNASQPPLPGMPPSAQQPGYPSAQNYLGQMHGSQGPMASQPYGSQMDPYHPGAAGAVDQVREGRKKSSIGRDIAIGVMIAAVVLGGFLAVKFLVLDSEDDSGSTASSGDTEIATLRIEMPENITAELFLDDAKTREASVKNGSEISVAAGSRKIRIVAPNGQHCDQELTLPAKQTVAVVCNTMVASAGSAKVDPIKPVPTKPDPAKVDPTKPDPTKPDPTKPDPTKVADKVDPTKPDPTKVKTPDPTKPDPKSDPTKVTVKPPDPIKPPDKTKPDPTKVDKIKPPRLPPEDNPADKLAAMGTKGFLAVTSNPSAKIAIDGAETGKATPIGKLPLSIGRHKVTFTLGGDKFTFSVTIKAGETTTLHKDLQ